VDYIVGGFNDGAQAIMLEHHQHRAMGEIDPSAIILNEETKGNRRYFFYFDINYGIAAIIDVAATVIETPFSGIAGIIDSACFFRNSKHYFN